MAGQTPQQPHLSPRQAAVLAAAADGVPLSVVAARLGTTRTQVSSRLSEAYRALDVVWLPRGERRAEAVRIARAARLIGAVGPSEGLSVPVSAVEPESGELGAKEPAGRPEGPYSASIHDGGPR